MKTAVQPTEAGDTVEIINELLATGTPDNMRDDLREVIGAYMVNDSIKDPELKVGMYRTFHALDKMLESIGIIV